MDKKRSFAPDAAEVRQCLFTRALEEADGTGDRVPMGERIAATLAAAESGEQGADFIRRRSALLGARLKGNLADAFRRVGRERSGVPGWVGPVVCAGAFLIGWLTHDLGEGGRVSLLAFPLLGLILWNGAVAVAGLVSAGMGRKGGAAGRTLVLPGWLRRKPAATGDGLVDGVLDRVEREWEAVEAGRIVARVKLLFHVAALLLAAGVVAGMYARGLVRNYQAGWESTFLTQRGVERLTGVVLGPASLVTGVPVPVVPPQGGLSPAAPWIHLWAASAGLFILIPRVLLISMARREGRRKGVEWLESFGEYEKSARRLAEGRPLVARVLPVQCVPDSPLRDGLRAVLQHLWGGQVMIDFAPGVGYGEEEECLAGMKEPPTHLVLLLPMAATPEDEVHGVLQRGLEQFLASAPVGPYALTVLDAAAFEARLAGLPERERRMQERRAAWEKVLGDAWPILILDGAARKNPGEAAAEVAEARKPLGLWTAGR